MRKDTVGAVIGEGEGGAQAVIVSITGLVQARLASTFIPTPAKYTLFK